MVRDILSIRYETTRHSSTLIDAHLDPSGSPRMQGTGALSSLVFKGSSAVDVTHRRYWIV